MARDSLALLLGAFCFIAPAFQDLLSSGLKPGTQTDTAPPTAKIFKMRVYSHFKLYWKTFSAPNASYKKYLSQFFIKITIYPCHGDYHI